MILDKVGNEIRTNMLVAYPGRQGSRCWLRLAKVIEVMDVGIRVKPIDISWNNEFRWMRESVILATDRKVIALTASAKFINSLPKEENYKETFSIIQRLNKRAKKWGLVAWLKRVLAEKAAQNVALHGAQMTGKTEFCRDLVQLGLVSEGNPEQNFVEYVGKDNLRIREYPSKPEACFGWKLVETRRAFQ